MKKVTAREFVNKRSLVLNGLKVHRPVAVTEYGQTVSQVSKPRVDLRRRLRAKELLQALAQLPMSEAEGNRILKDFAGEAVF